MDCGGALRVGNSPWWGDGTSKGQRPEQTSVRHGEVLAQAVLSPMTWDRGASAPGSSP